MDTILREKLARVTGVLRELGRVAVAYSGGVDSTLVLKLAHDALGENAIAVTAVSPSIPRYEREAAERIAAEIGARMLWIDTHELEDARYAANPVNRCYFCKTNIYDELLAAARAEGFTTLLDGTNADDTGDFRPGRQAALEQGARSLLQEAGITKAEVRIAARELGLANWDLPSAPCLSSRIPYGTPVTVETLEKIGRGEWALRERGFREVRVRHHGNVARIEVPVDAFERLLAYREEIVAELKAAGYTFVALDLTGLRSGSLNEGIAHGRGEAAGAAG